MLRAVVADLHLGQGADDLDRFHALVGSLAAREVGEVVFLGDLFRTLIGFPRFWDDTIRAGLAELAALRARGTRVVLVEGNRDFFLDAGELDAFRDLAGIAHSFSAEGRRFLLEHGDQLNRNDWQYLTWRRLSKSGVARLWARLLPRQVARRIVHSTEKRLAQTNFSYRKELPVEALQSAARARFAAGVDVVLWGHFHRAWSHIEGAREAHTLASWGEADTVVWIDPGGTMVEEAVPGR